MAGPLRNLMAARYARKRLKELERSIQSGDGTHVKGLGADLFGRGMDAFLGGKLQDPFTQCETVYLAVNLISTNGASVEWTLNHDGSPLEDNPLAKVMARPSEGMDWRALIQGTLTSLELTGKALWVLDEVARPGAGVVPVPHSIHLVNGKGVKAKLQGDDLVGWKVTRGGLERFYPADACVPFLYHHPMEPWEGLAPVEAARPWAELAYQSTRWQERFYSNGAVPPFYVTFPAGASIGEPQRITLREQFRSEYLGQRNAGKPVFLYQGGELKSVSVTQRDQEWAVTQRLARENILAVLGVPPACAGVFEDANRSNSEVQRRIFWTNTISPKLHLLAGVIQVYLVDRFLGEGAAQFTWALKARMAEAVPEDIRSAVESAAKLVNIGVPGVDAFEALGLDLDVAEYPWLATGWMPATMTPAELALNPAPPPPTTTTPPAKAASPGPATDPRKASMVLAVRSAIRGARWRSLDAKRRNGERRLLGDWRKFLTWLRDDTLANLRQGKSVKEGGAHHERSSYTPPEAEARRRAVNLTDQTVRQALKDSWVGTLAEVGITIDFNLMDPKVLEVLVAREIEIKGASDTAVERLRADLAAGIDKGETVAELAERVKLWTAEAYQGQALTVARTETNAAFSGARFAAFQAADVGKMEWLSAKDDRVRDSHEAVDGEVVTLGEAFSNGLFYPHEPGADAGEVVNCRCDVLAVLDQEGN